MTPQLNTILNKFHSNDPKNPGNTNRKPKEGEGKSGGEEEDKENSHPNSNSSNSSTASKPALISTSNPLSSASNTNASANAKRKMKVKRSLNSARQLDIATVEETLGRGAEVTKTIPTHHNKTYVHYPSCLFGSL